MSICHLIVALASESRPLIDHFRLRPVPDTPYRRYRNGSIVLTETGIGKLNAAAAVRHTTLEFIQSVKIVSDNPSAPLAQTGSPGSGAPDKQVVSGLIGSNVAIVDDIVGRLTALAAMLPDATDLQEVTDFCGEHFGLSATSKAILARLLQRYRVQIGRLPEQPELESHANAGELLAALQQCVDQPALRY